MHNFPVLTGIDHIHVYVKNRQAAAQWYGDKMGFSVTEALKPWAEDPQGPLTIEDASGRIHLALFQRDDFKPGTAIAFATDGEGFLQWKQHLEANDLLARLADHRLAWSMYFYDPDGNMHEITTYQYEQVAQSLVGN